nr:hypothetical protein GCM10020092_037000 [Actinoplanes digitatis]
MASARCNAAPASAAPSPGRQLDEQLTEEFPEFLAPRCRPVLEPVLGQQVTGVRGDRGAQAGQAAVGAGGRGEPLEVPHVDVDEAARAQHHHVVVQLHQPGVRSVAGEHAPGDVQRLVQIVRGRRDRPVRPQHVQQHVAVHPLVRREREQLDQRPGLAQAPLAGLDGRSVAVHLELTEQPDLHATSGVSLSGVRPSGPRPAPPAWAASGSGRPGRLSLPIR